MSICNRQEHPFKGGGLALGSFLGRGGRYSRPPWPLLPTPTRAELWCRYMLMLQLLCRFELELSEFQVVTSSYFCDYGSCDVFLDVRVGQSDYEFFRALLHDDDNLHHKMRSV